MRVRANQEFPVVTKSTSLIAAVRLLVESEGSGVVVVDDAGRPIAVVSPLDALRVMVPEFILDDPSLARVYNEEASAELLAGLSDGTVAELFEDHDHKLREIAAVDSDATVIEVAAELIRHRTTVASVGSKKEGASNFVSIKAILEQILATRGPGGAAGA